MKKVVLFLQIVLVASFSIWMTSCTSRKIDRPEIEKTETDYLAIDKIALTDTATILCMDAYHRPGYWVKVDSAGYLKGKQTGRIYKLLCSEGFELNKKTPMPENGNISFRLLFEPVSDQDIQLDYFGEKADSSAEFSGIWLKARPRDKKIHCRISGTVTNRPNSSRLMLKRPYDDERIQTPLYIPIRNGRFEYDLYCDEAEMYEIIFTDEILQGSWRPVGLFAEPGEIKLELYPEKEYLRNRISGPEINREYQQFLTESEKANGLNRLSVKLQELDADKKYYTPEAQSLIDRAEAAQKDHPALSDSLWNEYSKIYGDNDNDLSEEANSLGDSIENAFIQFEEQKKRFATTNRSVASYQIVYDAIQRSLSSKRPNDISEYIRLAKEEYMPAYPDHVYTRRLNQMLTTIDSIRVGGHYLDFTAPGLDGQEQQLSTLISGKIALIDLWASWCGGCRKHSKEVIPLYEKYKDKGFTVVGVARERNNTRDMVNAIGQDGYPWTQLVELNDRNGIWELYGIGGSGGGTWLVGRDGTILAVSPSAAEIEQILKQQL